MLSFYLSLLETDEEKSEFERLYLTYRSRMFAIAMRYLHNTHDAEDAVQHAFLKIIDGKTKIFQIDAHKQQCYLDIIIRNASIDLHKKNKRVIPFEFTENIEDSFSFESMVEGKAMKKKLTDFIITLPDAQREALMMTVVLKLTYPEAAMQLNITETALRSRIYQARKSIYRHMEKERSEND